MYAVNQRAVQRLTSNPAVFPPRPYLRLVEPSATSPRRRTSPAVFWRRRLVVMLSILALALAAKAVFSGSHAGAEASSAESVAAATGEPRPAGTYVVRQGDTLWAIARRLRPEGDVRPVVDRLAAQRRGAPLRVGERIFLP